MTTDFTAAAENGAELLAYLGDGTDATGITASADDDFYIIAYDAGDAFIYRVQSGDTTAAVGEIEPVVWIDMTTAMTAGALDPTDFLLA